MLEQIQLTVTKYWLWVSTLIIAILSLVLYRQGATISDLQRKALLDKIDNQLDDAAAKSQIDQESYNESIKKYRELQSHYKSLFGPQS